jgi:hypothetical protein
MVFTKTEKGLLKSLERETRRHLTSSQVEKQRLSFVMGSMPSKGTITRDEVKNILDSHNGRAI